MELLETGILRRQPAAGGDVDDPHDLAFERCQRQHTTFEVEQLQIVANS